MIMASNSILGITKPHGSIKDIAIHFLGIDPGRDRRANRISPDPKGLVTNKVGVAEAIAASGEKALQGYLPAIPYRYRSSIGEE